MVTLHCIQKLLKASHISPNGRVYSESESSFNFLEAATIAQQLARLCKTAIDRLATVWILM